MSHILPFFLESNMMTPVKRANLTSAWSCFSSASKSARVYRSVKKRTNKQMSGDLDLVAETEENQHKEGLEEIANTQWQVYRCSPLWNVKWKERERMEASESMDVPPNIMRMSGNV